MSNTRLTHNLSLHLRSPAAKCISPDVKKTCECMPSGGKKGNGVWEARQGCQTTTSEDVLDLKKWQNGYKTKIQNVSVAQADRGTAADRWGIMGKKGWCVAYHMMGRKMDGPVSVHLAEGKVDARLLGPLKYLEWQRWPVCNEAKIKVFIAP